MSLRKQRLLRRLDRHRLLVLLTTLLGQLDEHAAPVIGIAHSTHETLRLERVEPARHGAAREVRATSQPTGLATVRLARPAQRREHVPVADREAELVERLVVHPLDAPVDAADAVDDPLDRQVEIGRQVGADLLEEAVDVVPLAGLPRFGHVRSVPEISLDVKIAQVVVS